MVGFTWVHSLFSVPQKFRVPEACWKYQRKAVLSRFTFKIVHNAILFLCLGKTWWCFQIFRDLKYLMVWYFLYSSESYMGWSIISSLGRLLQQGQGKFVLFLMGYTIIILNRQIFIHCKPFDTFKILFGVAAGFFLVSGMNKCRFKNMWNQSLKVASGLDDYH